MLVGNRKEEASPGSGRVLVGKWDYQQFNESQEMCTTQKLSLKYYTKRPSSPAVTVRDTWSNYELETLLLLEMCVGSFTPFLNSAETNFEVKIFKKSSLNKM